MSSIDALVRSMKHKNDGLLYSMDFFTIYLSINTAPTQDMKPCCLSESNSSIYISVSNCIVISASYLLYQYILISIFFMSHEFL